MREKNTYVIATIKRWNIENAKRFMRTYREKAFHLICEKDKFTYKRIKKIDPRFIFIPHWSWMIPDSIYRNFECIVFHMTDLPFGRGGTPLQNLIMRGLSRTRISAIRVDKDIDAGPVYIKRGLSLRGSANQIYKRCSDAVFFTMIPYIMKHNIMPIPQKGRVVTFRRRTPHESRISDRADLGGIYDHIRMLDAEGYPHAFFETKILHFELTKAVKNSDHITAHVRITRRSKNN